MISAFTLGCGPVDGGFRSVVVNAFEQTIQDTDNVIVLDARTDKEFADGHIAGAVNIDVLKSDFESLAVLQLDKGKTIAVYCRSGRRSKNAAKILVANGYNVVELDCGVICWANAGKSLVR